MRRNRTRSLPLTCRNFRRTPIESLTSVHSFGPCATLAAISLSHNGTPVSDYSCSARTVRRWPMNGVKVMTSILRLRRAKNLSEQETLRQQLAKDLEEL